MSWFDQLGGLLQQYAGRPAHQAPSSVDDDFDQFTQAAPPSVLQQGIASAFRSHETPPFGEMVSQMFGQADPDQRAGLLNTLIGAAGPAVLSQVMGGGGGLSALGGLLGGGQVDPQHARMVPAAAVQQLAGYAEQRDPSIVDTVSGYFAQNPGLVKSLGAGALTAALAGLAGHQRGGAPTRQQTGYPGGVAPASQDPYGDPADQYRGRQVFDASQDPYGDPADQEAGPGRRGGW